MKTNLCIYHFCILLTLLGFGCDKRNASSSRAPSEEKAESKPIKNVYQGTITAQGFSQSLKLTLKTDFTEASINGLMTPLIQTSPGVYTWTTGTITGMSIRPEDQMCSIYTVEGELLGTLYKTKEELADGTERNNTGPKKGGNKKCGDEYSARRDIDGYLSDRGFNHLAGEYEAKITELRPISDCAFICKVQITSYQDPMGYDAIYKSFKAEWSEYDNKYVVTVSY